MPNLVEHVQEGILKLELDREGGFLIACSGGPDSMVLLDLMRNLYPDRVYVVYVKHNVRKVEQEEEIELIRAFCEKYSVPFAIKSLSKENMQTETTMRSERYAILQESKKSPKDYIVTAHHKNDLIETFLFRLMRGTGMIGTQAFSMLDRDILRPFSNSTKKCILKYAEQKQIPYCTDHTNYSDNYARNIIRHSILPLMNSVNTNTEQNLYSFISIQNAFVSEVNSLHTKLIQRTSIPADNLVSLNPVIAQHIIAEWLRNHGIFWKDASREQWENLYTWFRKSKSGSTYTLESACCFSEDTPHALGKNAEITLINEYHQISILKQEETKINEQELFFGENHINTTKDIIILTKLLVDKKTKNDGKNTNSKDGVIMTINTRTLPLQVRSWKTGDTFKPQNGKGTVKLQDLFINTKIPKTKRHTIPIIVDNNDKILWVCGIRCATIPPVKKDSIMLKLEYYAKKT